jgi:hypothetical protein
MLNAPLVAAASPALVAVNVYPVPVLVILQPANVPTPEAAAFGL